MPLPLEREHVGRNRVGSKAIGNEAACQKCMTLIIFMCSVKERDQKLCERVPFCPSLRTVTYFLSASHVTWGFQDKIIHVICFHTSSWQTGQSCLTIEQRICSMKEGDKTSGHDTNGEDQLFLRTFSLSLALPR